jgi:hypothetical protein
MRPTGQSVAANTGALALIVQETHLNAEHHEGQEAFLDIGGVLLTAGWDRHARSTCAKLAASGL